MEQDLFPPYLGQEVSSISEILNKGGFHLPCHCCPVCTLGNPPSHHVDPADTEISHRQQLQYPGSWLDLIPLPMENRARRRGQTQKG